MSTPLAPDDVVVTHSARGAAGARAARRARTARDVLSRVTRDEGFPTRDELVARYERGSGRSMTDVRWYRTLALWKAVVFMEGNYRRALAGSTGDPWLHGFGEASWPSPSVPSR